MKYNLANNEPLEVNGDLFVKGLGGYDGTNSQTDGIKTLQTVVEEKADKSYVDTETSKCVKLSGDNWIKGSIRHSS